MQLTTTGALSGNRQVKAAVMGLVVLAAIWELASWIIAELRQEFGHVRVESGLGCSGRSYPQ